MQSEQELSGGRIVLHLLDSAEGHSIQTWRFDNKREVKIGRATENDITITDSRVSRLHVQLSHEQGKWILRSHGRNGTRVEGEDVSEMRMRDSLIFQLGPNGPSFKFASVFDEDSTTATIDNIDPSAFDFLEIDEQRKAEELKQIIETDAFRELRERAQRLRQGNDTCIPETDA